MNCPHCGNRIDTVNGQARNNAVAWSVHYTDGALLPPWMPTNTWEGYLEINYY